MIFVFVTKKVKLIIIILRISSKWIFSKETLLFLKTFSFSEAQKQGVSMF